MGLMYEFHYGFVIANYGIVSLTVYDWNSFWLVTRNFVLNQPGIYLTIYGTQSDHVNRF